MEVISQSLPECFAAVQEHCFTIGATVIQVASIKKNCLGLKVSKNGNEWKLTIDCDWPPPNSLPSVHVVDNNRLLAHVSYTGWVCVNDSEALSIDLSRHADTVAQTVVAALDLLDKSVRDAEQGYAEFFNELEGYWSNLPSTGLGRTAVEVDELARAITSYVKTDDDASTVYFLENLVPGPTEFPKNEGGVCRSVYLPLEAAILPPAPNELLTVDFLTRLVGELNPTQQHLWTAVLGDSAKRERATLLASVPRSAGGRSLIGFIFGVVDGQVDPSAPISNLLMVRHTVSHMRERGGADSRLGQRHIVIFGCGSVGSEVADALASSGVGKLTLVDPQTLTPDNVFRHVLGSYWIGNSKARALRATFLMMYPGVEVEPVCEGAYRWLLFNTRTDIDGFVVALGMPTLERQLARALRQCHPNTPVVHTWLEPLDLGGHVILVKSSGTGCLDCLFRDDEGNDSLSCRTSYLQPGQTLTRNLTGCASTFTPYGAIQSRRTALLAAEEMLKALHMLVAPCYSYWAGDGTAAAAHGLCVTPWWNKAKTNGSLDMTRSMFGSACKHCRAGR